jgi:hypothetical protein
MRKGETREWRLCSGVSGDLDRETVNFLTFAG